MTKWTVKLKIYLDNNIVSGISKGDLRRSEMDALDQLLTSDERGEVDLFTSEVTHKEINQYEDDEIRADIEAIYFRLRRVEFLDDHRVLGFHIQSDQLGGSVSNPLVEDDLMARALREIGLHRMGAHHLMLAIKARCDVFLTCDEKTIIRFRHEIQEQFDISVLMPTEVISAYIQDIIDHHS